MPVVQAELVELYYDGDQIEGPWPVPGNDGNDDDDDDDDDDNDMWMARPSSVDGADVGLLCVRVCHDVQSWRVVRGGT
jgi:hypothetical protein